MSTRSRTKSMSISEPPAKASPAKTRTSRRTKVIPDDQTEKENTKVRGASRRGKAQTSTTVKKANRRKKEYCLCKKPDDGTPMVKCAMCKDWYHFKCINLSEEDAEEIEVYVCPTCIERTGRKTVKDWEGAEALEEILEPEAVEPTEPSEDEVADPSEPEISESEASSEDDYVADKGKSSGVGKRRARLLSVSSESAMSEDDEEGPSRRVKPSKHVRSSSSPVPTSHLKRKTHLSTQQPPPKRKKSSDASAAEDPTRKYCLGKLQEVFEQIFLRYPHVPVQNDETGEESRTEKTVEELNDEETEAVKEHAKKFATELEDCVYSIYAEPDKTGKSSAGGKYKERFRMLQFNLSKPDRVVLHKRIAASHITPKELSLMSSTDLANEETKQSIKIAEKEALEHSILQKAVVPRAKITHKGLQDIEDVNRGAGASLEPDREQFEEERRERERMARLKAQQKQQRRPSSSIPPESPITPQTPSWGAPPPIPMHLSQSSDLPSSSQFGALQRPPVNPLFVNTASELVIPEPELNLADLINIDEDLLPDGSMESSMNPDGQSSPMRETSTEAQPAPSAISTSGDPSPMSPTSPSPFPTPTKPEISTRSSFDLNSLWSAKPDPIPAPSSPKLPPPQEPKDAFMDMEILGETADDQDFDMFLEEKDSSGNGGVDNSPDAQQAAFESLNQVWTGMINMPLDSTIPQETKVVARQMGGRSLTDSNLWKVLFPSEQLRIDGRVPVDKSAQFLLQMRMNSSKELIAVAFSPESDAGNTSFGILIEFLIAKNRHGLVFPWGSRPKEHHPGKELYIIPLLSSDPIPDYMELLDELHLPKVRRSNYLVGIWILNKGKLVAPPSPTKPIGFSPASANPPPSFNTQHAQPPAPPLLLPTSGLPQIAPAALAAEVASLTPEQIQLMIQTLAAAGPIPVPNIPSTSNPIIPAPQQLAPAPPQPWTTQQPPFPNAYTPPHTNPQAAGARSPQGPSSYDYQDYGQPRTGSGYDRGEDRGWRGGRGRGWGRGRGGERDAPRQPIDSGWAGRNRNRNDGMGGGPSNTQQDRWRRWD